MEDPTIVITLLQLLTGAVLAIAATLSFQNSRKQSENARQAALQRALDDFFDYNDDLQTVFDLRDKPFEHWTDREQKCANRIAFALFHIGVSVQSGAIPKRFCRHYYYAIPTCWKILQPLVQKVRSERHALYWKAFESLATIAQEYNADTEYSLVGFDPDTKDYASN